MSYWWEVPRLDADCFAVFLQQFGQAYTGSLDIVLIDQAQAHRAQRVAVPDNVILV